MINIIKFFHIIVLVILFPSVLKAGMVSITFDDGLSSIYCKVFPIFKQYGQVATVGVITGKLTGNDEDFMNVSQLKELQEAGWEIASHSMNNLRPVSIPWYYSQEPIIGWTWNPDGSNTFQAEYLFDQIAGIYQEGQPLSEVDSLEKVARQFGTWYFDRPIAALHIKPLVMTDPERLNIRAGSFEREMDLSKQKLTRLGFKVSTFLSPGSYWTNDIKELSSYYYSYAVAIDGADNRRDSFDPHAIKRFLVHPNDSATSLIRIIQANALAQNGWVVLRMHGFDESVGPNPISMSTLKYLLKWLDKQNLKLVTISDGAATMANDNSVRSHMKKKP